MAPSAAAGMLDTVCSDPVRRVSSLLAALQSGSPTVGFTVGVLERGLTSDKHLKLAERRHDVWLHNQESRGN